MLVIAIGMAGIFNSLIGFGTGDMGRASLGGCVLLIAICLGRLYDRSGKN